MADAIRFKQTLCVDTQRVKIGPIQYTVLEIEELRSGGEKLDGDIHYGECKIFLEKDLGPPAKRQVLWHELLHIILVHSGRREHDDGMIDALAYGVMQVLADNDFLRTTYG